MSHPRSFILAAAVALTATAAAAQTSGLTDGPDGTQPNTLGSDRTSSGINSAQPSRAITNPRSSMYDSGAMLIHRHRHRRNYRHYDLRH